VALQNQARSFLYRAACKLPKPDIPTTSHALSYQESKINKPQQKLVQDRVSHTKPPGSAMPKRHIKIIFVNHERIYFPYNFLDSPKALA